MRKISEYLIDLLNYSMLLEYASVDESINCMLIIKK